MIKFQKHAELIANKREINIYDVNNEMKGKSFKEIINVVLNLFELCQNNKDIEQLVIRKSRSNQTTLEIEKKNRWSIEDKIIKRSKHQKLNKEQFLYLINKIISSGLSIKVLSLKYFVCTNTMRRIKGMTFGNLETFPIRKFQKVNDWKRSAIKQQIIDYYDLSQTQFASKEVQKHLINLNSEVLPFNLIVNIMKEDWNLAYKRRLSRPNLIDFYRI